MIDLKAIAKQTGEKLTSPTAFSWYGVAGIVATGVLTFLSTKKWIERRDLNREEYWDNAEQKILADSSNTLSFDEAIAITDAYEEELKNRPIKEKVREAVETALIFAPPVAAAVGSGYCILHGNNKWAETTGMLINSNNRLTTRLDKYKAFAAGAATSEVRKHVESEDEMVSCPEHRLYFSNDDLQHEDYGTRYRFCIEGRDIEFVSTPLEVLMAEYEFNKLIWGLRFGEFGSLNEFLDMLGTDGEPDGNYCGWSKEAGFDNGYSWVGFTHVKIDYDDGERGYMICFDSEPTYDELFNQLIHG